MSSYIHAFKMLTSAQEICTRMFTDAFFVEAKTKNKTVNNTHMESVPPHDHYRNKVREQEHRPRSHSSLALTGLVTLNMSIILP